MLISRPLLPNNCFFEMLKNEMKKEKKQRSRAAERDACSEKEMTQRVETRGNEE